LEEVKEKVRESIDIVNVVSEYVDLNRNLKGLCPFHDEKTPSFSVNQKGQYFHCFGCGVGGDVFRFLELMERRPFKEVLCSLAAQVGIDIGVFSGSELMEMQRHRDRHELLTFATDYYHGRLTDTVRMYLSEGRGLTAETIGQFRLGWADGKLCEELKRRGSNYFELAIEIGLLRKSSGGHYTDFFQNRLIFPNWRRGQVVHMTGRVLGNTQPKYLHLPGPMTYLYNEDALHSEQVIVAEGAPDCISVSQAGYSAVGILGTGQFNADHAKKFRKCNRVIVCTDGDEAGRQAAKRIGSLMPEKAYVASLPEAKDLNDVLRETGTAGIAKLLDSARGFVDLEIDAIQCLPENAKVQAAKEILPLLVEMDDFDRDRYVSNLAKASKLPKSSINAGLKQSRKNDSRSQVESIPDAEAQPICSEDRERAQALLNDPDLLQRFLEATEKSGCVGEDDNKILVYLAMTSRLLDKPISLIVKGDSSGGKSFLVEKMSAFMPDAEKLAFSAITPRALYHRQNDLSHKILIVYERPGAEDSDYSIRTLQSEGKLTISMAVKDEKTGKFETIDKTVAGPVAYIETTTRSHLHPENETRSFEVFIDESEEQTDRIHEVQRARYRLKHTTQPPDLSVWTIAQQILKKRKVKIPFVDLITFPSTPIRARRDHQRFLTLIETSALLHQFQRGTQTVDGEEHILASEVDYAIAYGLASAVLGQTIKAISPKTESLLMKLKEKFGGEDGESFQRKEVYGLVNWNTKTVDRCLKEAAGQGCLDVLKGGQGKAYEYQFLKLPTVPEALLKHPQTLRDEYRQQTPLRSSSASESIPEKSNTIQCNAIEQLHHFPNKEAGI
jgi:DNA primase catalytic core